MTSATDRLSFDVLGEIFNHYGEQETIFYPLETLLLVSRLWNHAAVGQHALWGRLRVYIGHEPTIQIWRTRLPLRMERAGAFVPLEIDLRDSFETDRDRDIFDHDVYNREKCEKQSPKYKKWCICMVEATKSAHYLLHILAGPNGENCKRWKTLNLLIGSVSTRPTISAFPLDALSYPTPQLSSLSLEDVHESGDPAHKILPSMPNLRALTLYQCHIDALPDLSGVREISLNFDYYNVEDLPDLSPLNDATLVKRLKLSMCSHDDESDDIDDDEARLVKLPIKLPHLQFLSLSGGKLPSNLAEVQASNLTHFEIQFDQPGLLNYVVGECKLPLPKIQKLTYWWVAPEPHLLEPFFDATRDLLVVADSLSHIEGDRQSLSIILKLFWDADAGREKWVDSYVGRTIELSFNDSELKIHPGPHRIVLAGPACRVDIETLASTLELWSPSLEWDDFQIEFHRFWG